MLILEPTKVYQPSYLSINNDVDDNTVSIWHVAPEDKVGDTHAHTHAHACTRMRARTHTHAQTQTDRQTDRDGDRQTDRQRL